MNPNTQTAGPIVRDTDYKSATYGQFVANPAYAAQGGAPIQAFNAQTGGYDPKKASAATSPIVATSTPSRTSYATNELKLAQEVARTRAMLAQTQEEGNAPYANSKYGRAAGYLFSRNEDPFTGYGAPDEDEIRGAMEDMPADWKPFVPPKEAATVSGDGKTTDGASGAKTVATGATGAQGGAMEDPYARQVRELTQQKLNDFRTGQEQLARQMQTSDETTAALIASITATYDARIKRMMDTNARMLEGKRIAGIAAGRSRYAPSIEEGGLMTEELDGIARISEIESQKLQLIAQAKQARDEKNIALFNKSMELMEKANAAKLDEITKLHQLSMDVEKAALEKQKAEKAAILDQTRLADSIAPAALGAYQSLNTPEERAAFIAKLAEKYEIPLEMVQSSMLKYSDDATKASLEQEMKQEQIKTERAQQSNYYSLIQDRKENPSGASKEKLMTQAETMLESGATANDGSVFNGRGADGYVDPYLYIQIYNGWETETEKVAFLKKFPPLDNINPEFVEKYKDELPRAVQIKMGI
jgi:hypothetical protein